MPTLWARLAHLPHDPAPEFAERAYRLVCGAPAGCRVPLGRVQLFDAARGADGGWCVWLPDQWQPRDETRTVWTRHGHIRRPKQQPWATGSGVHTPPTDAAGVQASVHLPHGAVRTVAAPRQASGHSGHLIGPLGLLAPAELVLVDAYGHQNHVGVPWIEQEVQRLSGERAPSTD
jgi:hypothetical protein